MIQPERVAYQDYYEVLIFFAAIVAVCLWVAWPASSVPAEPVVNESSVIVEVNVTPEETPTPEPTLSEAQYMEMYGGMKLGEWLSWQRQDVDMQKDISMHLTVYDYRMFTMINWYSVSWGQYFTQPAGEGRKYLFVFANSNTDEGSARTWGIQPEQFYVDINGTLYAPTTDLLPEIRIKEFDEVWNLDHVENVKAYGYIRTHKSALSGEEIAEKIGFLKCGKSNAWDGYIPYIVPADTKPEDVKVIVETDHRVDRHWWALA